MTYTSTMTASVLALALACFRETSAFVAPGTGAAGLGIGVDMHRSHRIEQPSLGRRRRSVPRLSMLKGDDSSGSDSRDVGRNSGDASGSSSGASTRLEFGAGVGAAAAAIMLGGLPALAEDTSSAVAGEAPAAAGVAEAAQESSPEVAAPPAAASASAAETRPLRDLGFEVPYTGKSLPLSKFLGSRATLVVNPKIDDPESLHQVRWCDFVCAHVGVVGFFLCFGCAGCRSCFVSKSPLLETCVARHMITRKTCHAV